MSKVKASQFVKQSMTEYGIYTCYHRAIPDFRDGLIPSHRRVIYTYDKHVGSGSIKVAELAGRALAYHPHGDKSTSGVVSELSRAWPGSNNYRMFVPDGAVGSVVYPEVKYIASPRYLSVKADQFMKDFVLDGKKFANYTHNYDKTKEEIEHYTPPIPVSLINGASNIAYGFSTDILPRTLESLLPIFRGVLNGDKSVLGDVPDPSWKGYTGTVEKCGPNKWYTHGGVKSHNTRKHSITDLPIKTSREFVMDYLIKNDIKHSNDSTDTFNITCYCSKDKMPKFKSSLTERVVIYKDGGLKEYKNVLHYILDFTLWRKAVYTDHIRKEIEILDGKIFSAKSKLLFIKDGHMEHIASKVKASSMSSEQIKGYIEDSGLCPLVINTSTAETTQESLLNLVNRIKSLKSDRADWNKKSGKSLYLEKLSALEEKYCL